MLRPFPAAALAENWVHEALTAVVELIHNSGGSDEPKDGWLTAVDASHRPALARKPKLVEKIGDYAAVVAGLSDAERATVVTAFDAQNHVEGLLGGTHDLPPDLPGTVADAALALFEHGFEVLTVEETRDRAYEVIVKDSEHCPFCIDEYFDQAGARRTPLDHYLVRGRYPFAAANLQNLVPMGSKCNDLKWSVDLLRDADNGRRTAFYPYGCEATDVELTGTASLEGGCLQVEWQISFNPASAEAETWDQVFFVRERLSRDVLHERRILAWINKFGGWCRRHNPAVEIDEPQALRSALAQFAEEMTGIHDRRDSLMSPVFHLLHKWCEDDDLLTFVFDLVHPPVTC